MEIEIPEGMITLDSESGNVLGFTSDKFAGGAFESYLWRKGDQIIIALIASRHPGRGDFRALVERILSLGFDVVVPSPLETMDRIVRKCGYTLSTVFDEGMDEYVELWTLKAKGKQDAGGDS